MSTTFISHSSIDKPFVRSLVADLKVNGINVWFDENEISPGDSFPKEIAEGLDKANFVVAIVTKSYLNSNWAQEETYATVREAVTTGQKRFIPLLVEDVWNEVSPLLRDKQYIDFRRKENIIEYRNSLSKLISVLSEFETPQTNIRINRPITILVTGGRDTTGNEFDFKVASFLGDALARMEFQLRSGAARGVDNRFCESADRKLRQLGKDPQDYLIGYTNKDRPPYHHYGKILFSRHASRREAVPELVMESDIAFLIGGGMHTTHIGVLMLLENRLVFPIAATGGAALEFHDLLLSRFDKTFGEVPTRDLFESLRQSTNDPIVIVETCMKIIEQCQRGKS